jgi:hypothetical protein
VKLARLSALTGILFAALFVLALVFVYTTPQTREYPTTGHALAASGGWLDAAGEVGA